MVGNEFGGATFYTAEGAAVPGTDLVPAAVDNGLSGERGRWWGRLHARCPSLSGRRCRPPSLSHLQHCIPRSSSCSVLANAMVALGLMVGTRGLAYFMLLLMHRLKRI